MKLLVLIVLNVFANPPECVNTVAQMPKLTKEQIIAVYLLTENAYSSGDSFETALPKVKAVLGEPDKISDNLLEWYYVDEGKTMLFYVTKANRGGHLARGTYEPS